jgi:hypothetical protein
MSQGKTQIEEAARKLLASSPAWAYKAGKEVSRRPALVGSAAFSFAP